MYFYNLKSGQIISNISRWKRRLNTMEWVRSVFSLLWFFEVSLSIQKEIPLDHRKDEVCDLRAYLRRPLCLYPSQCFWQHTLLPLTLAYLAALIKNTLWHLQHKHQDLFAASLPSWPNRKPKMSGIIKVCLLLAVMVCVSTAQRKFLPTSSSFWSCQLESKRIVIRWNVNCFSLSSSIDNESGQNCLCRNVRNDITKSNVKDIQIYPATIFCDRVEIV